ncbi:MAG TPA: ribosome maturation factor RimP [Cyclobacteriaceae bacterium]|jgi:ribosome maturation factor RimP|nr:ribosome maturation factor RimP [Cyclobacteriaceae bacterium]
MDLKAQLMTWTETSLENPSLFLVDVILSSRHLSKITVVIDGDQGVNIDECTRISRALSARLDELNLEAEHYVLEVTTPGLDQPLRLNRQYRKNIGRGVKVHLKDQRIETGTLIDAGEDQVVIRQEWKEGKVLQEKRLALPFAEIEKTYVVISFK